jgi:PAS domain S-box-containing protein
MTGILKPKNQACAGTPMKKKGPSRMLDETTLKALLDSIVDPIVFTDNEHVIRYVNPAAEKKFGEDGWTDLVGKSLMHCHNADSQDKILVNHKKLLAGSEEEFEAISDSGKKKIYARAVRNESGGLLGYYERYEPYDGSEDRD